MNKKITVIIADIHGCIEEFDELLNKIQYNSSMRLVLLGDLVDRGPDSQGVVARARELNLESVKGNHEDKMLRWLRHEKNRLINGVKNPMKSVSKADAEAAAKMKHEDIEYMQNLPIKIDLGNNIWAIHAGLEPGLSFSNQKDSAMMRVRYVNKNGRMVSLNPDKSQPENSTYWADSWNGSQSIMFGHAVLNMESPVVFKNINNTCIGLDTGCVFGGNLTAAFIKEDKKSTYFEYVQVKAKQKYSSQLKGE